MPRQLASHCGIAAFAQLRHRSSRIDRASHRWTERKVIEPLGSRHQGSDGTERAERRPRRPRCEGHRLEDALEALRSLAVAALGKDDERVGDMCERCRPGRRRRANATASSARDRAPTTSPAASATEVRIPRRGTCTFGSRLVPYTAGSSRAIGHATLGSISPRNQTACADTGSLTPSASTSSRVTPTCSGWPSAR